MRELKQSTAANLAVFMTDSSDHVSGKAGLTLTIAASKDGAAFASISPTVTELTAGWYKLALTSSHTDTLGDLAVHVTATGADPTDFVSRIIAMDKADAVRAGLSALPNAAAGANGGLPVLSSSATTLAYTVGTVTTLTSLPAITTDWLTAAGVSAAAVTKIQSGLATPTNITAGTITTVTTVNGLAAGVVTAASIASDAITADKIADGAIDTATFASGTTIPRVTLADTLTAYTGNTPQTGDAYARLGAAGAGLTALGDTRLANLDAAVSTRLATAGYTVPLDAAGVRSAVGLAAANLDTQLGAIGDDVTVGGYASGQDPATLVLDSAASAHNTAGTIGARLNAAGAAGDPMAAVAVNATTYGEILVGVGAVILGKQVDSDDHTATTFTDVNDTGTPRVTSTNTSTTRTPTLH
jgi:hypothetical protein